MNKFTKLILTTAVFATSGFATTEIKQDTIYDAGMTVSLDNGTSYVFSEGVTLHNYTTIQGPTEAGESADFKLASDATSANVIHYKDQLTKDDVFTKYSDISTGDYYRTMGEGSKTGNINVAGGITETTKSGDIVASLSSIGASDTIVLVGTDNDAVSMTDDSGNVVTISQNIANEKASGDATNSSKGLVFSGKFKLNGDNSHFNQEKVSGENAEIEFSGAKSLFQSDMEFSNSKITLSQTSPITFGKSLTIQGGVFVINTPNFTFSKGSSFFLKAPASVSYIFNLCEPGQINSGWSYKYYVYQIGDDIDSTNEMLNTIIFCQNQLQFAKSYDIDIENKTIKKKNFTCAEYIKDCSILWDITTGKIDYTDLASKQTDTHSVKSDIDITYKEIWDFLTKISSNSSLLLGEFTEIYA